MIVFRVLFAVVCSPNCSTLTMKNDNESVPLSNILYNMSMRIWIDGLVPMLQTMQASKRNNVPSAMVARQSLNDEELVSGRTNSPH